MKDDFCLAMSKADLKKKSDILWNHQKGHQVPFVVGENVKPKYKDRCNFDI